MILITAKNLNAVLALHFNHQDNNTEQISYLSVLPLMWGHAVA
jgi:hypothetical protein